MAVTKQSYTANNTWTASQLAGLFRSAFIDAGLMTEWYDSFVNGGIENRVLEVVYDGTKTYGKTYYWFMFTTSGVFYHYATGWDTVTKQPAGTSLLDFPSSTTNSTSAMVTLRGSLSTFLPVQVIRYTSQVDPTHDWYLVGQAGSFTVFTVAPSNHTPAAWVDLNKNLFHHLITPTAFTADAAAYIHMYSNSFIRRSVALGSTLGSSSTTTNTTNVSTVCYASAGRSSNLNTNIANTGFGSIFGSGSKGTSIPIPTALSSINSAYSSNYSPVCTGIPYSFWLANSPLPSDFGILAHFTSNTMQQLDKFIVTAGVEEWEILTVSNNSTVTTGASMAFVARVI